LRETLGIDMTGEWRMIDGDRPEYATPDFDDSRCGMLQLPLGRQGQVQPHWLRRLIILPEHTDLSRLTLTPGTIQDIYEIR
jgi:hypothetical protein